MTGGTARAGWFAPAGPLAGRLALPGDKSISHRALLIAALATGTSRIHGLSDGADVAATAAALRAMGVVVEAAGEQAVDVSGLGVGGLLAPGAPLDCGNSGTSARLLMGLVAGHDFAATFTGDESLSRRPMERVLAPLRRLGVEAWAAPGGRLPLTLRGAGAPAPLVHRLPLASAQVKSALLLAALAAPGTSEIVEPAPTRDHSERMLNLFGAEVETADGRIRIAGQPELRPQTLRVPGDPSSAAFLAVAALLVPGSHVRLEGICVNPRRTGLYAALRAMGGDIRIESARGEAGEPVADLVVRHSRLAGIDLPAAAAPDMIDEFPILFIAAAFAHGRTRARGLAELRVKESDRIAAMAEGLSALGVCVRAGADDVEIEGLGGALARGGATIDPRGDHRIAMSFAVAGLRAREGLGIVDMSSIATSFPTFEAALAALSR
jgi:3-phosphoshikimate 1-carboxyvinyltransferase